MDTGVLPPPQVTELLQAKSRLPAGPGYPATVMNTDLAVQAALDKLHRNGFAALSRQDQILSAVWLFESKVANGGFEKYYKSEAGDLARHVPAALTEIGAGEMAAIAAEANAVFGASGPPLEQEERRRILSTLGESARKHWIALESRYYDCAEDCDELLDCFLNAAACAV
jgi:hypothetical protein